MPHHPSLPPGVPHDSPLGQKVLARDTPAKARRVRKGKVPAEAPAKALVDQLKGRGS